MMKGTILLEKGGRYAISQKMEVGDIGVIINDPIYNGTIVLRTYSGLVSLTDPNKTWKYISEFVDKIELLAPGSKVVLEVE